MPGKVWPGLQWSHVPSAVAGARGLPLPDGLRLSAAQVRGRAVPGEGHPPGQARCGLCRSKGHCLPGPGLNPRHRDVRLAVGGPTSLAAVTCRAWGAEPSPSFWAPARQKSGGRGGNEHGGERRRKRAAGRKERASKLLLVQGTGHSGPSSPEGQLGIQAHAGALGSGPWTSTVQVVETPQGQGDAGGAAWPPGTAMTTPEPCTHSTGDIAPGICFLKPLLAQAPQGVRSSQESPCRAHLPLHGWAEQDQGRGPRASCERPVCEDAGPAASVHPCNEGRGCCKRGERRGGDVDAAGRARSRGSRRQGPDPTEVRKEVVPQPGLQAAPTALVTGHVPVGTELEAHGKT